jgi:hypothetical protein
MDYSPFIGKLMKVRPIAAIIMQYCSPYWSRKILDLVTLPWLPTKFMADVREMRRIVETMDSASRKAFSEKKTAMEVEEMPDSIDATSKDSHAMISMMDIMCEFRG